MLQWFRKIDDILFSPPHKFEVIFEFVVLQLGLNLEYDSNKAAQPKDQLIRQEPDPNR